MGGDLGVGGGEFSGGVFLGTLRRARSLSLQNSILREALRVLGPGGWPVGAERQARTRLLPVSRRGFDREGPERLQATLSHLGFEAVEVIDAYPTTWFRGRKPMGNQVGALMPWPTRSSTAFAEEP